MAEECFQVELLKDTAINIRAGQSILSASLDAGIPHYHACGGNGKCSTCRILVLEGMENLSGRNGKELALVKEYNLPAEVRLACQTKVTGQPVVVQRIIRDEGDKDLYLPIHQKDLPFERELVLMFLDIRNFTPFTAAFLPFDVIHILKKMFLIFEMSIDTHGGKIIETAGDGLYAVFGMNAPLHTAAKSAVTACENILQGIKKFNEQYLGVHFHYSLEIGIGLHAGPVIIGNIKVNKADHMVVMGYAVNIASRIQSATRELNNNFLISEKVAHLFFRFPPEDVSKVIHVKGVVEDVKVYSLGKEYLHD
ncbi:MAG: adenylate/guanylate cyclase domain-containing protein [Ginsengibacter sp.]